MKIRIWLACVGIVALGCLLCPHKWASAQPSSVVIGEKQKEAAEQAAKKNEEMQEEAEAKAQERARDRAVMAEQVAESVAESTFGRALQQRCEDGALVIKSAMSNGTDLHCAPTVGSCVRWALPASRVSNCTKIQRLFCTGLDEGCSACRTDQPYCKLCNELATLRGELMKPICGVGEKKE